MEMKLEVAPIGDEQYAQLTPPSSACSTSLGVVITKAKPGEIDGLLLTVTDTQAVYAEISGRGVEISEPKMEPRGSMHYYLSDPDGNT